MRPARSYEELHAPVVATADKFQLSLFRSTKVRLSPFPTNGRRTKVGKHFLWVRKGSARSIENPIKPHNCSIRRSSLALLSRAIAVTINLFYNSEINLIRLCTISEGFGNSFLGSCSDDSKRIRNLATLCRANRLF
jgi:hypothetical protein